MFTRFFVSLFPLQRPPPSSRQTPRPFHPRELDFGPFRVRFGPFRACLGPFGPVRVWSVSGCWVGSGQGSGRGASMREEIYPRASTKPFFSQHSQSRTLSLSQKEKTFSSPFESFGWRRPNGQNGLVFFFYAPIFSFSLFELKPLNFERKPWGKNKTALFDTPPPPQLPLPQRKKKCG